MVSSSFSWLLLPKDDPIQAVRIAQSTVPCLPAGKRITVSIGVAQHRAADTTDRTIARADAALYQAKSAGRNRVVLAD